MKERAAGVCGQGGSPKQRQRATQGRFVDAGQCDGKLEQLGDAIPVEVTRERANMSAGIFAGRRDGGMQRTYSGSGQPCTYAPGRLGSVKVNFLVNTGCTHNLLLKATFDFLPTVVKERLEPWETFATLADVNGLPIYGKIELTGRLRNFQFTMEFMVSRVADESVVGMAFLTSHQCMLRFYRGVLAWKGMPLLWSTRRVSSWLT